MAAVVFFARWWLGETYFRLSGIRGSADIYKKNVVIYGAGSAGVQLASALAHGREFKVVAFIDDDKSLHKRKVNGLRIYALSSLGYLIDRYQISDVLLAMPSVKRSRISELIHLLEPYALHVLSMPGLSDIAQGKVTVDALQEVDIADLLGRDCVAPDQSLMEASISGKVVMVTGAGGSIGSELCRQIIQLQPATLILFEVSEFGLYAIEKELLYLLTKINPIKPIDIITLLGSVTDANRLEKICTLYKVQTIYHAAAYKHVPMVEKKSGRSGME